MLVNPLFTIIVPIYNVEHYIEKCINSIIYQTYKSIEIVLVDDGSPDSCPSICDAYANIDSRIKVIHKNNGGLSDARNAGLRFATGEYIIFLDSDDYLEKNACEELLPFVNKKIDIIHIDAYIEYSNTFKKKGKDLKYSYGIKKISDVDRVFRGEEYLEYGLSKHCLPMNSWLYIYRREFLINHGLWFKFGILHEDEHFTPRALLSAKTIMNPGFQLYHYLIRDGSITQSQDLRKNCNDLYDTCCELVTIYNDIEQNLNTKMCDLLVTKYLSLYYMGRIYRYGKSYMHKDFLKRYATSRKNIVKVWIFCVSPRIYCYINMIYKKILEI
jgi:glycosyltransferase involved in cell wall biosynthesis